MRELCSDSLTDLEHFSVTDGLIEIPAAMLVTTDMARTLIPQ